MCYQCFFLLGTNKEVIPFDSKIVTHLDVDSQSQTLTLEIQHRNNPAPKPRTLPCEPHVLQHWLHEWLLLKDEYGDTVQLATICYDSLLLDWKQVLQLIAKVTTPSLYPCWHDSIECLFHKNLLTDAPKWYEPFYVDDEVDEDGYMRSGCPPGVGQQVSIRFQLPNLAWGRLHGQVLSVEHRIMTNPDREASFFRLYGVLPGQTVRCRVSLYAAKFAHEFRAIHIFLGGRLAHFDVVLRLNPQRVYGMWHVVEMCPVSATSLHSYWYKMSQQSLLDMCHDLQLKPYHLGNKPDILKALKHEYHKDQVEFGFFQVHNVQPKRSPGTSSPTENATSADLIVPPATSSNLQRSGLFLQKKSMQEICPNIELFSPMPSSLAMLVAPSRGKPSPMRSEGQDVLNDASQKTMAPKSSPK